MRGFGRAVMMSAALLVLVAPAFGQSLKMMQVATDLGTVFAAEEPCGLSYDQDAIGAFIEKTSTPTT